MRAAVRKSADVGMYAVAASKLAGALSLELLGLIAHGVFWIACFTGPNC